MQKRAATMAGQEAAKGPIPSGAQFPRAQSEPLPHTSPHVPANVWPEAVASSWHTKATDRFGTDANQTRHDGEAANGHFAPPAKFPPQTSAT